MVNLFDKKYVYSNWINDTLTSYKVYKNDSILLTDQKFYKNGDYYEVSYYENGKVNQVVNKFADTVNFINFDNNGKIVTIKTHSNSDFRKDYCQLNFINSFVSNFTQYSPNRKSILREFHSNGNIKSEIYWSEQGMVYKFYDENGVQFK